MKELRLAPLARCAGNPCVCVTQDWDGKVQERNITVQLFGRGCKTGGGIENKVQCSWILTKVLETFVAPHGMQ